MFFRYSIVFVYLFIQSNTYSQILVPLHKYSSFLTKESTQKQQYRHSNNDTLHLPFFEDFTDTFYYRSSIPNPALWKSGSGVKINNSSAIIPPSYNTAVFDGADTSGIPYNTENIFNIDTNDILTSLFIDLSEAESDYNIRFTFYWQAGGLSDQPEEKDFLLLEFKNNSGIWIKKWQESGKRTTDFTRESIAIDPEYFSKDFQFRFTSYGRQGGSFDIWNIDYIHIYADTFPANIPVYFDAALTGQPTSLFKKYHAISKKQLLADNMDLLADTIFLHMKNLHHIHSDTISHYARLDYILSGIASSVNFPTYTSGKNIDDNRVILQKDEKVNLYGFPSNLIDQIARDISLTEDLDISLKITFYLESKEKEQTALLDISSDGDIVFFSSINDTLNFDTHIGDYLAYDDGDAEYGYELKQRYATLAYQYELNISDVLIGVDIYIPRLGVDLSNQIFELMVWQNIDTTKNSLDEILLNGLNTSIVYTEQVNEFRRILFNKDIFLPKGKFYIGYRQISEDLMPIGYDANSTSSPRIFTNTDGKWNLDKKNTGNLMIRPVFGDNNIVGLNETTNNFQVELYPNPATDHLIIKGKVKQVKLYNILGKLEFSIANKGNIKSIDLSNLKRGLYFVHTSNGKYSKIDKVIIK